MKEKKFISVVVYMHNVADGIIKFLDTVIPFCKARFEEFEIVCVNDASTDMTVETLKDYLAQNPAGAMVNVIHMSFFQGLETAMNAGRDIAIGDFVYEFDTTEVDYEPELMMKVYEKLLEGNDIVAARSNGAVRVTSKLFYALYNSTSRAKGKIGPETFRLISRRAINRIQSMGQYIPYRKAVYSNCGLNMATVTYESRGTGNRKKKAAMAERTGLAMDSFIYFTNALERISAVISGVFLLLTVGMGIWLVMDLFNADKPVEGWLSTMGFLALGFFGVFALLTIILKYLSVLLNLVFKQQRYLIADIEKVVNHNEH